MTMFDTYTDRLVAHYDKTNEDGQPVDVLETALPARFYTIVALPSEDSLGHPKQRFALGTGSGTAMEELAHQIARAIADGMLGLEVT